MTPQQLTELSHKLKTQDNACTADPIFVVYNEKKIYGMDPEFAHEYKWINQESGDYTVANERSVRVLERYEKWFGQEPKAWAKRYYITVDEFVTCSFTKEEAESFIKRKSYDYDKLFVYVESLYRMPEMKRIREMLLKGPEKDGNDTAASTESRK